jgi:hypothetical protein
MKKRSNYRIVKPYGPNDYRVQQKVLWFFWCKPDDDNIIANDFKSLYFSSEESAEAAITQSLEVWNNPINFL